MIEYTINDEICECEYISTALNQIQTCDSLESAEIRTENHSYEINKADNGLYQLNAYYHGTLILEVELSNLTAFRVGMDVMEI